MKTLLRFRKFLALPRSHQTLVVEALAVSLYLSYTFRRAGVGVAQARLRRWSDVPVEQFSPEMADFLIRSARRAQVMVKRATGAGGMCLARSLTLWALLRKRGLETQLRVGYRKRGDTVEGHAWLEFGGRPINEDESEVATYSVAPGAMAFDDWRTIQNSGD